MDYVEDDVEDLAQGVYPGSSGRSRGRETGLYVGPLFVGEVGWVCLSHACYSSEPLLVRKGSDASTT